MPSSRRKFGVMVVDDFDDTRELFAEVLMHEGHHSIMAAGGAEALARLQYVLPDLILTDLEMPGMSGAQLISEIRRDPRFVAIPIIVVSGAERAAALAALGADASHVQSILRKPVKVNDLVSAVADALGDSGDAEHGA